MRLFEINQNRETIVIYGGRFQPPHIGHMKAWQWLENKYGNAIIATSDKVDPPRSPFNFNERKQLLSFSGVPDQSIQQVKNPYIATEIVSKYDPAAITLLFAVSEKDMEGNPRFQFKPKKDGSPSYFQSYSDNIDNLKSAEEHAYIVTVPTFNFNVLGKPMKSATEFRAMFAQADDKTQIDMITDMYGKYDKQIHSLMKAKIN